MRYENVDLANDWSTFNSRKSGGDGKVLPNKMNLEGYAVHLGLDAVAERHPFHSWNIDGVA